MKIILSRSRTARGFTLAEVVIAAGIVAGTLAILAGIMSVLTRDVARVRPYEAGRRLAFDPGQAAADSSKNDPSTSSSNATSSPQPLPDEQLDPAKGRDEATPKLDPDDPEAKPADGTTPAGNTTTTNP